MLVKRRYSKGMAQIRKDPLVNNHYYHVFSRSIAKYVIFSDQEDYDRFYQLLDFYRFIDFNYKYSHFLVLTTSNKEEIRNEITIRNDRHVDMVAYCLMPTHIHLILKQVKDGGISKYMSRVLNSYSRYFNTKHGRIGPLWSGRFKSVLIDHDEQLLHITRYIHLNPTSANLIDKPENWPSSSYNEYIGECDNRLCRFGNIVDMSTTEYKKFTENQKDYQRNLSIIKYLTIEKYSG